MTDIAHQLQQAGIRLRSTVTGNHKTTCPKCSHTRRKKNDPCLSVTVEPDKAVWNCHNHGCGFVGNTFDKPRERVTSFSKKAAKPDYRQPDALPENVLAWFAKRGISPATLKRNRIGCGPYFMPGAGKEVNAIQFPYLRGGEAVNIKYRDGEKHFCQVKGAEKIFYGVDDMAASDTAIITEGEMDKLALEEAGFLNVISVPDGAPAQLKPEASPDDKKFEYIANSWPQLEHISTFILAVDSDEPGKALEEELARRLGREKCKRVSWPTAGDAPCKDANEVLMQHGKTVLRECIELAAPYPIRNLVEIDAEETDLLRYYHDGMQTGLSTGWECMDRYLKIREGLLVVITGLPSSGKSEWLDALMVNMAESHNWIFAIASFENPVEQHRAKLLEKRLRKPFGQRYQHRMTESEILQASPWIREHFQFMHFGEDSPTIEAILETARAAVRRHGIKGLVIDPYNEIEHKRPQGVSETEYVSQMLSQVKRFAQNHGVTVFFIAHPAKPMKDKDGSVPVPGLYDISGSANWVNKADIGIVVHRDQADPSKQNQAAIYIKKVRWKMLGQQGTVTLTWDKETGRFSDPGDVARATREAYAQRYGGDA